MSTHQILADAMSHGFVSMDRIGVLIFDEAHHCVQNHPAHKIMKYFYWPRLNQGLYVPSILGLTASPVMKADPTKLEEIEGNLNAISRTPIVHRGELMVHVHIPKLERVVYHQIYLQQEERGRVEQADDRTFLPSSWANLKPPLASELGQSFVRPPDAVDAGFESDEYESIDALTGESSHKVQIDASEDEFESVDPYTGLSASVNKAPDPPVAKGLGDLDYPDDASEYDYEDIDPYTGELLLKANSAPTVPQKPTRDLNDSKVIKSSALDSLNLVYESMDISKDPYMLELQHSAHPNKQSQINKLLKNKKTYSQEQMRQLAIKGSHISQEYGGWAADWFIGMAIQQFQKHKKPTQIEEDEEMMLLEEDDVHDFNDAERQYICDLMRMISVPKNLGKVEDRITPKVEKLIEILLREYEAEVSGFSGLVFVEQRVGVLALSEILTIHPRTKDYFRPGTVVGSSGYSKRALQYLRPLMGGLKNQDNALLDFKSGTRNIIIATSVIEEGLDIQDCHLVVCFVPPKSLKSFVQRRGRARRVKSSYIIMYNQWEASSPVEFEKLEKDMIRMYSDTQRELGPVVEEPEEEEGQGREMRIEGTGALLTMENSVPHLYHFCACLPVQEFVDLRPDFRTEKITVEGNIVWTAEVVLPNSIHPDIRRFTSTKFWKAEKWARRDVAFEAFKKLYSLGQVDDNLMPLVKHELQSLKETEKRTPRAMVDVEQDIWQTVGRNWETAKVVYASAIEMTFSNGEYVAVDFLLPIKTPNVEELQLFWTMEETVAVKFGPPRPIKNTPELLSRAKKATLRLLKSMHSNRMKEVNNDTLAYLFLPTAGETWDLTPDTPIKALEIVGKDVEMGILADHHEEISARYTFVRWRTDIDPLEISPKLQEDLRHQPVIEAKRLTRRRDFLHIEVGLRKGENTVLILPSLVYMDTLPLRYSRLSLLLPFALDRIEKTLLAENLKLHLDLAWMPTNLMVHAITASSARDPVDYQRLEFLGDSALKVLASVSLVDQHPLWHEGYLTGAKDRIVSNTTSGKAAVIAQLSRWIITKPATGQKWSPRHVNPTSKAKEEKLLSTKVLADVVEAIIGVAYLTDGFEGATICCSKFDFGHGVVWSPFRDRISNLVALANENARRFSGKYPTYFADIEAILGYTFTNKALLLEAITHLSYGLDSVSTSYQRLEFLGDPILDIIIVNKLYHNRWRKLTHIDMHHLKSACVNAGFLAFLCLGATAEVETVKITPGYYPSKTKQRRPLYKYLRSNHTDIQSADAACNRRYNQIKSTVNKKLQSAPEYPWTELTGLDAPKHISDIIESLIAAIWVDSKGDFGSVEAFIKKLGILDMLERLIRDGVEADHPMSRFGRFVAKDGRCGVVKYKTELVEDKGYNCELEVSGTVVSSVEGGVSRQHAKTWAAKIGLGILMKGEEEEENRKEKRRKIEV